jgi:hypothetical protein
MSENNTPFLPAGFAARAMLILTAAQAVLGAVLPGPMLDDIASDSPDASGASPVGRAASGNLSGLAQPNLAPDHPELVARIQANADDIALLVARTNDLNTAVLGLDLRVTALEAAVPAPNLPPVRPFTDVASALQRHADLTARAAAAAAAAVPGATPGAAPVGAPTVSPGTSGPPPAAGPGGTLPDGTRRITYDADSGNRIG